MKTKEVQIIINGNISHFKLPKKMVGCKTAQEIHAQCKLSIRRILKKSRNEETKKLYKLTNMENVSSDYILESTTAT